MTGMRQRLTGRFRVPLAPSEAFVLFTPLGERQWAHGWDPRFPVPSAAHSEPGTVFETDSHGRRTTWIVTHRAAPALISYARVTPGDRAGTVTVTIDATTHGSEVDVTYDLTALTADAEQDLQQFADGYAAYLQSWQDAIIEHLAISHEPR